MKKLDERYGDQITELVFISIDMNRSINRKRNETRLKYIC
ncbi:hypothetical protein S3E15_02193 [Bacillus mycoides]|uniref:Uncharacterized protein n=1 Tax=Bacillus mycoides TaxID=1405 RepID=A0AAP7WCQ6_BACMY|nr:hypothetical protein BTJ44_03557 [Bacillus mycoides]OSX95715.1 hypothetical protein S3E15_02193 [Bacillus mycoides]OSY16856.1 hypothetical protein BTJ48_00667 [Bacillus mycoides]QWG38524.1 cobalamin biosynthesis protein [Bacillus mycoides]QWI10504.1 cobalamin biosynthesis protein [Bacillus mycoides]